MDIFNYVHPLILVIIATTINWLLTFFGASLVYFVKKESKKLTCIALGSSAGIMIAATFFSLLLPAIEHLSNYSKLKQMIVPLGFLCGVVILRILDKVLPHEHIQSHHQEGIHPSKYSKSKLLMFAMALHNIPEGLAVGVSFAGAINGNYLPAFVLALGVGIQNFPEGSAISIPMHQSGKSKFKAMMYGQFSGFVELPSAIIGFIFASLIDGILPFSLAFAAGAMMFVCVEDLIPEANSASDIDIGTISYMIGFIIMMAIDILIG